MTELITRLKQQLGIKDSKRPTMEADKRILLFESENDLLLPPDLTEYFKLVGNTVVEISDDLYQFYTIDEFKSIKKGLSHWGGIPDYRNIINTLEGTENCFVFAEYMFHSFAYAIRLYKDKRDVNEIYSICGDSYRIIANSFSDFLNLYFEDSIKLYDL